MTELRSFTKNDYYGYAGAEVLSSGKLPHIAEGSVLELVISGYESGCMINIMESSDDQPYYRVFEKESEAFEVATKLLEHLDNDLISLEKLANKFELIKA